MHRPSRGIILLLLACMGAPSLALADTAADPFARDMLILTDWFEGEFDNEEQRWFEADPRSSTPTEDRAIRIHTAHKRIELPGLPELGKHVFYVEEYKDNDPTAVIRQRLVSFRSEPGGIRMKQGFFRQPDAVRGGQYEPQKLASLSNADVYFLDQCDVYWRRLADQFHGEMKPKACVFGDGDERRYSVHNLMLSVDKYWRVDSTFLVANDTLFRGYPIDKPIQMRRSKTYFCDVYFYHSDGESQIVNDIRSHSQGGLFSAIRERDGATFDFLIRDKEYPYYESRPDFMYFSIRHGGEQRSIAFSVSDPDSRTFGIKLKEVGAFCHQQGYRFREPIELLNDSRQQP